MRGASLAAIDPRPGSPRPGRAAGRPRLGGRAALAAALVALALVGVAPTPPSAAVTPTTDAPATTWRGRTEAWVGTWVYPALLGRSAAASSRRYFADRSVQTSPGEVARGVAATPEARRRQAGWAYQQGLGRSASSGDAAWWAEKLAADWSHDRMVSHLLASAEHTARYPSNEAWIGWAFQQVLGRRADAQGTAFWDSRLDSGVTRAFAARQMLASGESRRKATTEAYAAVLGRSPTSAENTYAQAILQASGGDLMRLRAEMVSALAPGGFRVGVVGDSIGFDLVFRTKGQPLPSIITGGGVRPRSAGRLGCGVLSDITGYRWPRDPELVTTPSTADWGAPSDGRCVPELKRIEAELLRDHRPQVLVWAVGAWEWTAVKRPNGTIIAARSAAMREEVASAMVRRIDAWVAAGVKEVVLPEWACPGAKSAAVFKDPAYSRFVRSILDVVVARRPTTASIAKTPPEVCAGGDPTATSTAAHRAARGDQFHWTEGPSGAAWGWRVWFAPAVADVPDLTA